jgi:UDP-N-acetyl-2-amino-2-deoxyglucuronate dehydrogenase
VDKTTRFAIVGCGVIAPTHARSIFELPGTEIVAACDVIEERARSFTDRFGGKTFTDYHEMFASETIDVVNVCTPSGLHAEVGIAAAQRGIHVIVEKPIDTTLEKANALIHACREADVKLAAIFQHRFDPSFVHLRKVVEEGKLGRLVFGGAYTQWYRSQDYYDSGDWRGTWEMEGGGALINQGIHYVDLLQHLMGPVERLHAFCTTLAHERIEVEDTAVASLHFKNGATGVIESLTSAYPGFCSRLEIFGTQGGIIIEDDQVKEYRLSNGEVYKDEQPTGSSIAGTSSVDIWHHGHRRQIADFLSALKQDNQPMVNGEEGRKALAIILAVYQSAKTGQPVNMDKP